MMGRVPRVAAADTARKRDTFAASCRISRTTGFPGSLFQADRHSVIPGIRSRSAATAAKESWKEMSNSALGENRRITKAARARVLGRSLARPIRMVTSRASVMRRALTVDMPRPATKA